MLNGYEDIREKLGEPNWFDDYGVPRYCVFEPRRCGVYLQFVAFIEIACQDCGKRFLVASEVGHRREVHMPTPDDTGSFHYGDPPIHGCIGDTMNCEAVRILEFWRKDNPKTDWSRDQALEFIYEPTQAADAVGLSVEDRTDSPRAKDDRRSAVVVHQEGTER